MFKEYPEFKVGQKVRVIQGATDPWLKGKEGRIGNVVMVDTIFIYVLVEGETLMFGGSDNFLENFEQVMV